MKREVTWTTRYRAEAPRERSTTPRVSSSRTLTRAITPRPAPAPRATHTTTSRVFSPHTSPTIKHAVRHPRIFSTRAHAPPCYTISLRVPVSLICTPFVRFSRLPSLFLYSYLLTPCWTRNCSSMHPLQYEWLHFNKDLSPYASRQTAQFSASAAASVSSRGGTCVCKGVTCTLVTSTLFFASRVGDPSAPASRVRLWPGSLVGDPSARASRVRFWPRSLIEWRCTRGGWRVR